MIITKVYHTVISKHRDAMSFIILFFFLLSFIASRTIIYLNTMDIIPDRLMINRSIRGVHVHHLAFGVIILTVTGYLSLAIQNKRARHVIAALYGIGLGLAYDEFGMWLMLEDSYWVRQSYDAIAIITVILINVVYFGSLWQRIFLKTITLMLRILNLRFLKSRIASIRYR